MFDIAQRIAELQREYQALMLQVVQSAEWQRLKAIEAIIGELERMAEESNPPTG